MVRVIGCVLLFIFGLTVLCMGFSLIVTALAMAAGLAIYVIELLGGIFVTLITTVRDVLRSVPGLQNPVVFKGTPFRDYVDGNYGGYDFDSGTHRRRSGSSLPVKRSEKPEASLKSYSHGRG